LAIDPSCHIDFDRQLISIGGRSGSGREPRQIQVSAGFAGEIAKMLEDSAFRESIGKTLGIDPGFVRRKFYERAEALGYGKHLATPEMIRQSRAVELIRSNMPLPAVQMLLGHSTPNPASSYVSFSNKDIQRVTRFFMEKESARKTSARNSFFGKIRTIVRGTIQARVELVTISGYLVTTVITVGSLDRLGITVGSLVTAEVKAPWLVLQKGDQPQTTAENRFRGVVELIRRGDITCEYIVSLDDGTELCALVTRGAEDGLNLAEKAPVWVLFNGFAVILHLE
jgi:molybdate transport system regulatory protein